MSKQYNNLQQALLSVELAYKDLNYARNCYDTGRWGDFIMRVRWALNQLQSAVSRLEEEKEPEKL